MQLTGGFRFGWCGLASSRCEFGDDLPGGGQVREKRFGLGQGGGQVLYLVAQFAGPGCGLVVLGLKVGQELDDVHAASPSVSRKGGAGVVRRRVMFAMEAQ
ncbi:hypothetical protein AB0C88_32955 [Streptomyces chartreusis]|uniref:hypothetical protein n=1 Tax=Streptomyces TaxID=1883 RepID=UPI0015D56BF7|nr:hypothetical protein [Streptomyces sp. JV178]